MLIPSLLAVSLAGVPLSDSLQTTSSPIAIKAISALNTPSGIEYAPRFTSAGLVYSYYNEEDVEHRTELMISPFLGEELALGERFSKELSSPLHESSAAISPDGSFIVFSRNQVSTKKQSTNALFLSRSGVLDYQAAEKLPFSEAGSNSTHPTLCPLGKRIIFSSDREGGYGGYDLYYVERTPNGWSEAVNLGEGINTAEDEVFPFWGGGDILVFSSNRGGGLGGLDLYRISIGDKTWQTPERLGEPFNSAKDDHGLSWNSAVGSGVFASNRAGSDDLYTFPINAAAWIPSETTAVPIVGRKDQRVGSVFPDGTVRKPMMANTYTSLDSKIKLDDLCLNDNDWPTDLVKTAGVKISIKSAQLGLPLENVKLLDFNDESKVYTTDKWGQVCLPNEAEGIYTLEKNGYAQKSIQVSANELHAEVPLKAIVKPERAIVTSNMFKVDRVIATLPAELRQDASRVVEKAKSAGYAVKSASLKLVGPMTRSGIQQLLNECKAAITESLGYNVSLRLDALSSFSDEVRVLHPEYLNLEGLRIELAYELQLIAGE